MDRYSHFVSPCQRMKSDQSAIFSGAPNKFKLSGDVNLLNSWHQSVQPNAEAKPDNCSFCEFASKANTGDMKIATPNARLPLICNAALN